MQVESKRQNYEAAGQIRDQINHLEQLLQTPVLPEEYLVNPNLVDDKRQEALQALQAVLLPLSSPPKLGGETPRGEGVFRRIEMYDIANLAGKAATGAMTVATDGQLNSKYYRHFTIKGQDSPNDVAMMQEMLERRLKNTDWPKPDLIVLDGGMTQLSITKSLNAQCPIISLAKQDEIIFLPDGTQIKLARSNPGLKLLQVLRDEAHRFSRRLHHKHRAQVLK